MCVQDSVATSAKQQNVIVQSYNIIYELIDGVRCCCLAGSPSWHSVNHCALSPSVWGQSVIISLLRLRWLLSESLCCVCSAQQCKRLPHARTHVRHCLPALQIIRPAGHFLHSLRFPWLGPGACLVLLPSIGQPTKAIPRERSALACTDESQPPFRCVHTKLGSICTVEHGSEQLSREDIRESRLFTHPLRWPAAQHAEAEHCGRSMQGGNGG